MASRNVIVSMTFEDEKKERVAAPFYTVVADTATLATLITAMQNIAAAVEATSSSLMLRNRMIIDMPLPAGIKTVADAGSDNEETGLITMGLVTPSEKSFGFDIPAINPVVMDTGNPNLIDQTNAAIVNLVDVLESSGFNNLWSTQLAGVRSAIKTFRKHRRAAKRVR